jgi:hypothetical protein
MSVDDSTLRKWVNVLLEGQSVATVMIKLAGKRAVPELLHAVDDPRAMAGVHPPIEHVCKCLQPYAPKAKPVVPRLIACLPQLKSPARGEVTSLLISIGCNRQSAP